MPKIREARSFEANKLEKRMLSNLEFARERYRQTLMVMPGLVEEARSKTKTRAAFEAKIDALPDRLLEMQRDIRQQELESEK